MLLGAFPLDCNLETGYASMACPNNAGHRRANVTYCKLSRSVEGGGLCRPLGGVGKQREQVSRGLV